MARLPPVPEVGPEVRRALREGGGAGLTGDIFTDGSGAISLYGDRLSRTGWAVVEVQGGREVDGVYGTLPGGRQTVPRAELYAIRVALALVVKPARIFTDHQNHVRGFRKGPKWCTDPLRAHVDLWEQIWLSVSELGGLDDELVIEYTPAHRKAWAGESKEYEHRRLGNGLADKYAKAGRELHGVEDSIVQRYRTVWNLVTAYAAWVGEAARLQGTPGVPRDAIERQDAEEAVVAARRQGIEERKEKKGRLKRLRESGHAIGRTAWGSVLASEAISCGLAENGTRRSVHGAPTPSPRKQGAGRPGGTAGARKIKARCSEPELGTKSSRAWKEEPTLLVRPELGA